MVAVVSRRLPRRLSTVSGGKKGMSSTPFFSLFFEYFYHLLIWLYVGCGICSVMEKDRLCMSTPRITLSNQILLCVVMVFSSGLQVHIYSNEQRSTSIIIRFESPSYSTADFLSFTYKIRLHISLQACKSDIFVFISYPFP